ncbi:hypothetical protein PSCICJ_24070 [Pseudomonas cichorii]|nr:hypothetical protein PSCICJ_24070 [Pseudomonas cichorii]
MFQPFDRQVTLRTAINQIACAEQAVDDFIEANFIQNALQSGEMSMDIANREIASDNVDIEMPKTVHHCPVCR